MMIWRRIRLRKSKHTFYVFSPIVPFQIMW